MTDFSKLKVVDLKAELKKRGLPQTGLKPALIERLRNDEAQKEAKSREAPPIPPQAEAPEVAPKEASVAAPEPPATTSKEHAEPSSQTTAQASDATVVEDIAPPVQEEPPPAADESKSSLGVVPSTEDPQTNGTHAAATSALTTEAKIPEQPAQIEPSKAESPTTRSEAGDDSRKRKRRSLTPPPPSTDATAQKKAKRTESEKTSDDGAGVTGVDSSTPVHAEKQPPSAEPAQAIHETDELKTSANEDEPAAAAEQRGDPAPTAQALQSNKATSSKDARFQSLFAGRDGGPTARSAGALASASGEVEVERVTEPSIHPATCALYIRDFMRPLHPPTLRAHLVELATRPGDSAEAELITDFFLDTIRTHALVCFSSVAAASRVRSALHRQVWPEERARKPLWVDFVPEEALAGWIESEKASGAARDGKRWEVVYDTDDSAGHDGVSARLQEVGAAGRGDAGDGGAGRGVQGAPLGPRSQMAGATAARDGPAGAGERRPVSHETRGGGVESGFSALDTHFRSTTAKPKLYFLPVEAGLADERLEALARESSSRTVRGRGGLRAEELRRYTFEDGKLIVDLGPEFRAGGPRGPRGYGGHRGYRGGGGGPWRGRAGDYGGYGGRGGLGFGGGSAWRDGPPPDSRWERRGRW